MSEMKPCPFCRSPGARIVQTTTVAKVCRAMGFAVECPNCGVQFPGVMSMEGAAILWNNRAPVAITDEMVERAAQSMYASYGPCGDSVKAVLKTNLRAALAAALNGAKA